MMNSTSANAPSHAKKHLLVILLLSLVSGAVAAQTPKPVQTPKPLAKPAAETPEMKRGRLLYIQCRACHEVKAGLPHKVGPNLNGMVGRKAGTTPGFTQFSTALKTWGQVWDVATLDKWVEKPSSVVPGNSMAFAGLAAKKDRDALVAYLLAETTPPK